jgi:tRNA threonylcarbamoyladenosine biosynthesis protein TsaB
MLLLIDTSQETGTIALSKDGLVLFSEENKIAKEHASWLYSAITRLLEKADTTIREMEAIAVVAGPGSYTGLRVGMAAAKGFCYALKVPLITQNTLRVMAESMISVAEEKTAWICPLIDARRNEVFSALYQVNTPNDQPPTVNRQPSTVNHQPSTINHQPSTVNRQLSTILPPQALILDKTAFELQLASNPIVFFGSGAEKWEKISNSPNALFYPQQNIIQAFARLTQLDFTAGAWADPIYSEPVYLKEFFSY